MSQRENFCPCASNMESFIPLKQMNSPLHRSNFDSNFIAKYNQSVARSQDYLGPEGYIPLDQMNTALHRSNYDMQMNAIFASKSYLPYISEYYANSPLTVQTPYNYMSFCSF